MAVSPDSAPVDASAVRPPRWLSAAVGAVCLAISGSFLALAGLVAKAIFDRPETDAVAFAALGILLAIGLPFAFLSRTLLFGKGLDRPSLISPITWKIVAAIFFVLGGAGVGGMIWVNRPELIPGLLPSFAFGRWALLAANARARMQSAA